MSEKKPQREKPAAGASPPSSARSGARLVVGRILAPHGVRGLLRVQSFTAEPEAIFRYKPLTDESGERSFKLSKKSAGDDGVFVASIDGVDSRTKAEQIAKQKLYLARELLPAPKAGEVYIADLIGLTAQLESGEVFGRVTAVHNFGAGDILEITPAADPQTSTRSGGKAKKPEPLLLPMREAFVPKIDLAAGTLVIRLPVEL